jgi:hypothetical protein
LLSPRSVSRAFGPWHAAARVHREEQAHQALAKVPSHRALAWLLMQPAARRVKSGLRQVTALLQQREAQLIVGAAPGLAPAPAL